MPRGLADCPRPRRSRAAFRAKSPRVRVEIVAGVPPRAQESVRNIVRSRQVIVELQPNRVDVVMHDGGRSRKSARIRTALDTDPHKWVEGVLRLKDALSKTVADLHLEGHPAVVFYSSPTQVVELVSTEVKSTADACDAARLRCIDSLSFSSLTTVSDSICIGRDTGRGSRKLHALAALEREDVLNAMADLVEAADLRFEFATPISASILRCLAAQALHRAKGCQGRLYLGERHSYFLISDDGRIIFSRIINIGIDDLARSLTRPIRMGDGDESVELDVADARTILLAAGIPTRPMIIDETRGLTSQQILPLLQPVLQRLLVELRQSLRFGLNDQQRSAIRIETSGPGSSLAGMTEYLVEVLELPITADVAYARYDANEPAAAGSEFLDAIRDMGEHTPIQLLPERHAAASRKGKLRQWLWAGAAAAVLMITLDGIGYQIRIDALRENMQRVEGLSEEYDRMKQNGERLRATLVALNGLESCVLREMGVSADYRAALQEVAAIAPEHIRFTKIQLRGSDADTALSLTGYAFDDGADDQDRPLERFMEALEQSPLFADARLVTVQASSFEQRSGRRFEISGVLLHVPTGSPGANASAGGEATP